MEQFPVIQYQLTRAVVKIQDRPTTLLRRKYLYCTSSFYQPGFHPQFAISFPWYSLLSRPLFPSTSSIISWCWQSPGRIRCLALHLTWTLESWETPESPSMLASRDNLYIAAVVKNCSIVASHGLRDISHWDPPRYQLQKYHRTKQAFLITFENPICHTRRISVQSNQWFRTWLADEMADDGVVECINDLINREV